MQMEIVVVLQLMLIVLVAILLMKLSQLKKQVTQTIKEVKEYITFVTEDIEHETQENAIYSEKQRFDTLNLQREKSENTQSQLIHAVLQEYFP